MAKTPRTWTGARTPSGLKRVRQAERRREILQPRRTAAKTYVAKALDAATHNGSDAEDAATVALAEAHSALDRAAKAGAIHPNAAARRKSRLTLKFNAATGGAHVQTTGRVTKQTGKAQAAKAAKVAHRGRPGPTRRRAPRPPQARPAPRSRRAPAPTPLPLPRRRATIEAPDTKAPAKAKAAPKAASKAAAPKATATAKKAPAKKTAAKKTAKS